ncbi:unnamed protein product [Anisakis simplex]|uniref:PUM-HD domain-containing protein n=1 Tax=Anisakis simplex TaxID=6269 RepID=A0A0M3IYB6_ANISI|nr:unnamed protein product [Anisakis simplex]
MVSLHGKSGKMKRKPTKVLKKKQKKVKKVKTLSLVDKTDDEVLRKNTKANAKKIPLDADKPKKKRPRTVSSGSSVCQEESIGEKKKRVSFAKQLESTNDEEEISKDIKNITTNASPGKSILARKVKATKKAKSKLTSSPSSGKEDKENSMDTTSPPDQEKVVDHSTTKSSPEADQTMNESKSTNGMEMEVSPKAKKKHTDDKKMKIIGGGGVEKVKKHTKIQVTRKVKEKLMTMNRKERRAFIKELQRKRKPNFDLALKCKQLWEKIRSAKCQEADREKYVHELYGLVKGKAKELIYAHDTCRVIECLTSLPKGTIRSLLFDELCPEIVRMSKSKYARFFVTKMLKNGYVYFDFS